MSTFYFDCRVCGEETGTAHSGSDPDALICEYCEEQKMTLTDEQTKQQARWIFQAIVSVDGTEEERQALSEIFHVEGFGGDEDRVMSFKDALRLVAEKLEWLRDQREEGLQ